VYKTIFFFPEIFMKTQTSTKVLRELLETPKCLVAAALLVDIKAQQWDPGGI
jgi:hypothetical protein